VSQPGASVAIGLRATVRATVAEADTAVALGSGEVQVLGTPRLLALAEAATVAAVGASLGPGQTTVGTAARLEHQRPSPVGTELTVEAELTGMAGRRLVFSFVVWAGDPADDLVAGAGEIERVVVDRDQFESRAQTPVVDRG
jgi:fluoroacetyl-CoA thioesterase